MFTFACFIPRWFLIFDKFFHCVCVLEWFRHSVIFSVCVCFLRFFVTYYGLKFPCNYCYMFSDESNKHGNIHICKNKINLKNP